MVENSQHAFLCSVAPCLWGYLRSHKWDLLLDCDFAVEPACSRGECVGRGVSDMKQSHRSGRDLVNDMHLAVGWQGGPALVLRWGVRLM